MVRKVKFGLIGAGNVANYHMLSLSSIEEAEITALCDLDKNKLKEANERFKIKKLYTDYHDLLKDENVDVVEVLTPPHTRSQIAVAAAESGKHVILEKPMCRSLKEADDMIEAARKAGVKLMMAESYVFTTTHMKARELIESGEIGEPMWVRSIRGPWMRKDAARRARKPGLRSFSWRLDPVRSGGGEYAFFFLHNVHFIAAARYLMGSDVEKIYAVPRVSRVKMKDGREIMSKEIVAYFCQYNNGTKFSTWKDFGFTFLGGKRVFNHLGFKTVISGTEGMIEVFGEGGGPIAPGQERAPLILHREGETRIFRIDEGPDLVWLSVVNYYNQAFKNELEYFASCILNDEKPRYTGEDGRRDVQLTLAAIKSAIENRPVKPEEISEEWTAFKT